MADDDEPITWDWLIRDGPFRDSGGCPFVSVGYKMYLRFAKPNGPFFLEGRRVKNIKTRGALRQWWHSQTGERAKF